MSEATEALQAASAIFRPGNPAAWCRWRDAKLACAPASPAELVVEVRDPCRLTEAEHAALLDRCRRANMAVYACSRADEDKGIPRAIATRLGLVSLDANFLSDEDGITSIRVEGGKGGAGFIPYTDRPIRWHTDGYYNEPGRRIRGVVLHCVRSAAVGGENGLVDPEMTFLWLREREPAWAEALFTADAMTIPERLDDDGVARPASVGPVFSLDPATGDLQMRYTARTRSIAWKDDPLVRDAATWLLERLDAGGSGVYRARLEPGMGIICNNVLHDRTRFTDEGGSRLLYRARYLDRVTGTEASWRAIDGRGP